MKQNNKFNAWVTQFEYNIPKNFQSDIMGKFKAGSFDENRFTNWNMCGLVNPDIVTLFINGVAVEG